MKIGIISLAAHQAIALDQAIDTRRIASNLALLGVEVHVINRRHLKSTAPITPFYTEGIMFHQIPQRPLSSWNVDVYQYLKDLNQYEQFDCIHSMDLIPDGLVGVQIQSTENVPLIISLHPLTLQSSLLSETFFFSAKWVIKQSAHVILPGLEELSLLQKFVDPKKVTSVPRTFDPYLAGAQSLDQICEKNDIRSGIIVTRLRHLKNKGHQIIGTHISTLYNTEFTRFLKWLEQCRKSERHLQVVIFGDFVVEVDRKEFLKMVQTYRLKRHVSQIINLDYGQFESWAKFVDLWYSPSQEHFSENLEIAMQAKGVPFVHSVDQLLCPDKKQHFSLQNDNEILSSHELIGSPDEEAERLLEIYSKMSEAILNT